jgi:hypothetical protein
MFNKCFIYFVIEPECLAFTDLSEKVKFDLFVSILTWPKNLANKMAIQVAKKIENRIASLKC